MASMLTRAMLVKIACQSPPFGLQTRGSRVIGIGSGAPGHSPAARPRLRHRRR
jgi:hypothetical protein